MTEPIQAVEVPTPRPKLPRRWVWVYDLPDEDGDYPALARADMSYHDSGRKDTIYLLPASDEAAKPVVSAIPTVEEMEHVFAMARGGVHESIQAIHALVASRAVVQEPVCCGCGGRGKIPVEERPCNLCETPIRRDEPPLDPIRAIVEILEIVWVHSKDHEVFKNKLAALKRSLTGAGE